MADELKDIRTTCPYCGTGCGVLARADGQGGLVVRGDGDHPANAGRLCSKGLALGDIVGGLEAAKCATDSRPARRAAGSNERLLYPQIGGKQVSWDQAMGQVAQKFSAAVAEHGPDSVAFYVSGQLLTEDYYVANKLTKGFIGSANIDTNSRLCMASSVAGHRRAFGADIVPGIYDDFEAADLIVLNGSNLAWCHPVLYQRIAAEKARRPALQVVVVDPRRTASCDLADMHLRIAPGGDVALYNGLLAALADADALNHAYLSAHVDGLDAALAAAKAEPLEATGIGTTQLAAFFALWARSEKVVTIYSQGVNQSTSGTDKVNAILNCHLATGRIGRPGMGPFSVTGQPNAMGGREVGGMANMLAAHLDIADPVHRHALGRFWGGPSVAAHAGLTAVDLFRAVARGQIKALWIAGSNPAASLPEADKVAAAIKACAFTVVSDVTAQTDTAQLADIVLPVQGWGEKDGTVTNSERVISRQRAVLPAPGAARADWQLFAELGQRMGWQQAFSYDNPAQIFREHAALSGLAAGLGGGFDISDLAQMSDADYAGLKPQRWPVKAGQTGGRFFGDGGFFTANGRAKMLPLQHSVPAAKLSNCHPFRLNTGRIRDQWHTMTRTGMSARLSGHIAEPFVEIHPDDAAKLGIEPADLVQLDSLHGQCILRAMVTDRVMPGQLFAPIHWTAQFAPTGRIGALIEAQVDPVSGQPETKAAAVSAKRYAARWFGYAVSAAPLAPRSEYWAKAKTDLGWRAEIAGMEAPADWEAEARALFGLPQAAVQQVEDKGRGIFRYAFHVDNKLQAALFVASEPVNAARDHLANLLGGAGVGALVGRARADMPDPGPIICACFSVGVNTIMRSIAAQGLVDVEAIGQALQAGTNCGSCRPELAGLLARSPRREAAQ
ncbi:MAG: molybdopterin-dependent oxidoreductase [Rhodobacteraceae bacterium]|nr:molybdopterin-dependent oxidoreductase [Paracoccaceae bacterium]